MGYKMDMFKMMFKRPSLKFRHHSKKEKLATKNMKYAQIDNAEATIIFSNGYNTPMKLWDEVFCELSKQYTVFTYNRKDRKNSEGKRVSSDKVEELRELLIQRRLKPPYILVGHSLGGLYMQYYARKYPEEVIGMVLVDSPQSDSFDDMSVLPNKMMESKVFISLYREIDSFGKRIAALPTISIPIVAITASNRQLISQYPERAPMINRMIDKQKEFPDIYPNAKIQWVDSDHMVQYEKPKVVIDAVREVINAG